MYSLLGKFIPDKNKLSIYCSAGLIWLFYYNSSRGAVFIITDSYLCANKYYIFIWIFVLIVIGVLVRKIQNRFVVTARNILASTAILIITANLIGIGMATINGKPNSKIEINKTLELANVSPIYNNESLPNIYYIVLDEYPATKELKYYFNFDNSEFEEYLKNRGFYIVKNSYCNYCWTYLSDLTTLNMEYLADRENLIDKLTQNKASKYFKSIGYKFVMLQKFRLKEFLFDNSPFNNSLRDLVNMTFLLKPLGDNCLEGDGHKKMIFAQLKMLKNLVNPAEPTFVYVHIMAPHRPYVFDQNGEPISYLSRFFQNPANEKLFLNQLIFTNKMIKEIVDKLINESRIQPIIILQGDHGPLPFYKGKKEMLKLRMSILNAYLIPREARQILYDSITPVNSFRLILGKCFGINLPLLKDESYYSKTQYSKFIDVTNEIK